MKETERILKPIDISLARSIEILGKVGEGEITLGDLKMPVDSELSEDSKLILHLVLGY